MVNRVETGVGAVDRIKKGQKVNTAEKRLKRTLQHSFQPAKIAAQAIDVGDELDLVFQIYLDMRRTLGQLRSA